MKYLARLLATPEPPREIWHAPRVASAESDERGAYGTYGTPTPGRIPEIEIPPALAALPAGWRDGLAKLAAMPAPARLWWPHRWPVIVADALALGERWGEAAHALGWTECDLWGCYPDPAARRGDHDGLTMALDGRPVVAITATVATLQARGGHPLRFARRQPMPGAVTLWARAVA